MPGNEFEYPCGCNYFISFEDDQIDPDLCTDHFGEYIKAYQGWKRE